MNLFITFITLAREKEKKYKSVNVLVQCHRHDKYRHKILANEKIGMPRQRQVANHSLFQRSLY